MLAVDFGHEKTQFIWAFLFSKPVKVTLGTSIKEISFGKRTRTKQRPKKLQQKYYCNTSRKVLHAALEKKNRCSNIYIIALEMRHCRKLFFFFFFT